MKHTFRKQHFSTLFNGCLLLVLGATLLFGACADDDLANEQPNKHTGTTVAFNVSDAQMETLAQAGAKGMTRGLSPQPLSSADLAPRKLEATGSNPHDFCLIESTIEGINPVKPAEGTRAEIIKTATLGNFSSIGYRAASSTVAANPSTALLWFHGEKTNPDGTLNHRYDWDWPVNVYGRFYAVYPEATPANKITLSPSNYAQVPYVDFEVNQDVKQQKDLMTACSGEVHYIHGNDPTSNLKFRHALAAVKFSIGSNLSPVTITKIELTNVKYKGRYRLPNQADGSDAVWTSVDNATTTMVLDNISLNAAEKPNTMLAGALSPSTNPNNRYGRDKYTFLMIPQVMPAKTAANAIKAILHYKEGGLDKTISIPLTGEWKANTTIEYKLSQKNSSWGYQLTLTDNNKTFDYQANPISSATFTVTSYRQGGGTQQAVPWKISKYEEWDYTLNGGTGGWVDRGTTKPTWLGDITDHGNGGTAAEACNTAVKAAPVTDQLAAYNQALKDATPKGTTTDPYNLANPGGNGSVLDIEETANCYLISAPGLYCIPIVYGNALKKVGGLLKTNNNSFHTNSSAIIYNSRDVILHTFLDHADHNITNPIIGQQLGGGPDDATIVWMDRPNLVRSSSLQIVHNVSTPVGSMDYLEFEVKKEDIRNGNAVIAVRRGSQIVWSWHLWFAQSNELDKIPVKNYEGISYNFTRGTLGAVHLKLEGTDYQQPRRARLTIKQQLGKQFSTVEITQNPGRVRQGIVTLYQFGRKDALPGTNTVYDGNSGTTPSTTAFSFDNGSYYTGRTYGYAIQNPDKTIGFSNGYATWDWCYATYINTWSANNAQISNWSNDAVVKTVYDPCPAGFHLPAGKAFTGFAQNGSSGAVNAPSNGWNTGWNFYTQPNPTSTTPTIFFPTTGSRYRGSYTVYGPNDDGGYWTAISPYDSYGFGMGFSQSSVASVTFTVRSQGMAVRPVADN